MQIHLQQNRLDLAVKETQQARKWAQDSLLVNIAESWVGLREVGQTPQPTHPRLVLDLALPATLSQSESRTARRNGSLSSFAKIDIQLQSGTR